MSGRIPSYVPLMAFGMLTLGFLAVGLAHSAPHHRKAERVVAFFTGGGRYIPVAENGWRPCVFVVDHSVSWGWKDIPLALRIDGQERQQSRCWEPT